MSMGTLLKDPQETTIFTCDWTSRLATSETISSSSWTVGTGLTKVTDAIVTGNLKTNLTVSGGTAGAKYACTNTIVTSNSQTLERTGYVQVNQL